MNRSAMLASIGFIMGTGRNNPDTTEAVFRIVKADDYASFRNKLMKASDDVLVKVLKKIDQLQPGALPAGWKTSAGIESHSEPPTGISRLQ